ncbi:MAG TPA: hypothetical protein VFT64_09325 [Rickettsiales bacterium]|nr:hypothetical protein [Rickettsiales bacterium]
MKKDEMKEQYDEIAALYDLAEELASTVESKLAKNPKEQLALVEPFISDIADSTDVLTEEYISIMEEPSRKKPARARIEKALRKMFTALDTFRARAHEMGQDSLSALATLTDTIATKIQKQTEKIMLIFMHLVDISLERIMRKHELDEFRRRNEQIVNSIPQHSH